MPAEETVSAADLVSLRALFDELGQDSDRAAVIVAAAWCDESLRDLLFRSLRPPPGKRDELLDGDAPLGAFSARINACQRFGIIDDDVWRTLHLLRRLRNDCAHSHEAIDLDQPPQSDRVRELIASVATDEDGVVWVLMRALVTSDRPDRWVDDSPLRGRFGTAKGDFRLAAAWIAQILRTAANAWKPNSDVLSLRHAWRLLSHVMHESARPDLIVEHGSGPLWSPGTTRTGTKT